MTKLVLIAAVVLVLNVPLSGQTADVAKKYFTDTPVVDQHGKTHRFYSDLMDGKVVIIASFHADCTSVGPPMMKTLGRVMSDLEARAGEFNILFLSVDPEDTPARAKALATRLGSGSGWYFLTGEKANMEIVLKKLGMHVANKEEHSPIINVGNLKTGLWKKVYGLGTPTEIKAAIESVLNDGRK